MTRINIIPPCELFDQHLIAEYREIFMIAGSLRRTLNSKTGYKESRVPKNYTLNKGHVYFFYNKGFYLHKRYNAIIEEMQNRGFKPDLDRKFPANIFRNNGLYNDWNPEESDYRIIKQRIKEKIALKPNWYRKTR
jgi:deoxyribonuclease (pyrimidine dimer)